MNVSLMFVFSGNFEFEKGLISRTTLQSQQVGFLTSVLGYMYNSKFLKE